MKPNVLKTLMIATISAAFICTESSAQDVQFFDGGYAELCSDAARDVGSPTRLELTGSRLDKSPLEICTLAIRSAESVINRAGSYNNRGVILFAQGSIAEALEDFEQAIRVDDTLAQAHINRGYTLAALKRWEESLAALDRGLALGTSTELAKAHFNRGIAHEELGHVREAYLDYLKASELNPLWEEPKQELTRFSVQRR